MGSPKSEQPVEAVIDPILGYLNFGSGAFDPRFLANLNQLYAELQAGSPVSSSARGRFCEEPELRVCGTTAETVGTRLRERLQQLNAENSVFRDVRQATLLIDLVWEHVLPDYLETHRDLFFHQSSEFLLNSFFLGRVLEESLKRVHVAAESEETLANWDVNQESRLVLRRLNDFLGHRPVATLESQKLQPYAGESFRPLPVFIADAGVATGPYQELVEGALKWLARCDPHLLREAQFDPQRLSELAVDPRAFDFDHPINQRPNHHFGQWDEDLVDQEGYYRRFVLHQVTLDSLLERVAEAEQLEPPIPRQEALIEASAALACTMLMGSGISGAAPLAHDSETSLATLIPVIAQYRDRFYEDLLDQLEPEHRRRLLQEAQVRQQPFGAVRQDLNARLAHRRATQLVNCRLASIFARMGYPEAAQQQSSVVPVASARFHCQIDCLLATGNAAVDEGDLVAAYDAADRVMQRLQAGIECGAIVDPWNILGFDANYSLFPALENTVRDHRIFDLLDMMDREFALLSRISSEAAASDDETMQQRAQRRFRQIVNWWRKYAAHEVSSVQAVDPEDLFDAAATVSQALNLWHKGGAAAGDMDFWVPHAELLDTPKAFSLVIDALLQRDDYQTASALLICWIDQSDTVPLEHGDSSFHNLMFRWIVEQQYLLRNAAQASDEEAAAVWGRIRKFYDYLEANAGEYWSVPEFDLENAGQGLPRELLEMDEYGDEVDDEFSDDEEELDGDDPVQGLYDGMPFQDSADDGIEGEIHHGGMDYDDRLEMEADRILDRVEFLTTLAAFWGVAGKIPLPINRRDQVNENSTERLLRRRTLILNWIQEAAVKRQQLTGLLESINAFQVTCRGFDRDAMVEYDQQRLHRDLLLENTINTCIEFDNAIRMLASVIRAIDFLLEGRSLQPDPGSAPADSPLARVDEIVGPGSPVVAVYAAMLLNEPSMVEAHFDSLTTYLHSRTPLYVPLSKGGDPTAIVEARVIQTAILELLRRLPAMGLFGQTYELTRTALDMERNNPVRGGAVTEFDEIFEVSYSSMVSSLVDSTAQLRQQREQEGELPEVEIKKESQRVLFDCIEMLTESMLPLWLDHSRTLRLSVLEKVRKPAVWERLVDFIRKYGEGLFTQSFFHLGNVRAILHQGVDAWLEKAQQSPERGDLRLFDELGTELKRETAVRFLTIVLESIRENFNEYVDYNTTTTQSDHGNALDSFLDFLRLRARYDRVCWHLKPVVWAHRILVTRQENSVARMWRRSLTERVGPEADKYLQLLDQLRRQYSIQMSSVGRRLEGRFGHQLQIDRLRALVAPSMATPRTREAERSFELLQHEAQAFLRSTNGVGVDLPEWLAELENEVHQYLLPRRLRDFWHDPPSPEVPPLPIAELREKIEQLPRPG